MEDVNAPNSLRLQCHCCVLALITWGAAGFMAQPTIASFAVHFIFVPIALMAMLWLAHWEGAGRHE